MTGDMSRYQRTQRDIRTGLITTVLLTIEDASNLQGNLTDRKRIFSRAIYTIVRMLILQEYGFEYI